MSVSPVSPQQPRVRRKVLWTDFIPQERPPTPTTTFYVCLIRDFEDYTTLGALQHAIDVTTGEAVARIVSTYGGDAVELPWSRRDKAYDIMTTILHAGCPLFTQTRMCVNVHADDIEASESLTPAKLEEIIARRVMEKLHTIASDRQEGRRENWRVAMNHAVKDVTDYYPAIYAHPSYWITERGRDLLEYMRQYDPEDRLRGDSSDEEVDTTDWDVERLPPRFVPLPPADMLEQKEKQGVKRPVEASTVAPIDDASDTPLCVVCLENVADTLVLPCMHQVVCQACSGQLRKTPNARKCVVCRGTISSIEVDETK